MGCGVDTVHHFCVILSVCILIIFPFNIGGLMLISLHLHIQLSSNFNTVPMQLPLITSVYREKKHPYDCFTNLSKDKHISMTALWCPAFGNHG